MPPGDASDPFQLAGTTLEGRFEVARVVAEGGFGIVYRAQQAALDRPIALKVLKTPARFDEGAKAQFLASFATEAKTIARIAHPNIVQVFDFGVLTMPSGARAAWMALEWLTGTTLEDELLARRGHGGRSPAECFALMKPVVSALATVHTAGVAHRDLKPANIMVVQTPDGRALKLLDFGIAKIMGADEGPGSGHTHTRSSQIAFSPGYAAPEQISNGRSGPWTDVHAMALILTEILIDRAPLQGRETSLIFQQIVDRLRPSPAKFGVEVGAWEPVLCRALSISPSERYRDAGELLRALEATVTDANGAYRSIPDGEHAAKRAGLGEVDTLPVESTGQPQPKSVTTTAGATSQPKPHRRGARTPLYVAAGVLVCATVAFLSWQKIMGSKTPAAAVVDVAPTTTATPAPPSAPASQTLTPVPTPSAPIAVASTSPAEPPHVAPAAHAPRPTAPRPAASAAPPAASSAPSAPQAPKPNCNPPYFVDSAGHRQFKPECL